MTLTPYSPATLDALTLRLLDVAALVRNMANKSRENGVDSFALHGNKVQEWMGHLEEWAYDGAARLESQVMRERGARRSQTLPNPTEKSIAPRRGKRRKKSQ
jgi:hypothetical protein